MFKYWLNNWFRSEEDFGKELFINVSLFFVCLILGFGTLGYLVYLGINRF